MGMSKMDIVSILGTMFTSDGGTAKAIGLVTHFMMGIVFVIIYASVWNIGLGQPTWIWGLVFGGIHGVLVLIVMPLVLTMHPRRPEMAGGVMSEVGLIMGHLIFGLVAVLVYSGIGINT